VTHTPSSPIGLKRDLDDFDHLHIPPMSRISQNPIIAITWPIKPFGILGGWC